MVRNIDFYIGEVSHMERIHQLVSSIGDNFMKQKQVMRGFWKHQNSFGNIKILSQIYMYDQDVTVT